MLYEYCVSGKFGMDTIETTRQTGDQKVMVRLSVVTRWSAVTRGS